MTTATLPCPHCGTANVQEANFCESCGKALPAGASTGPRIISGADAPMTDAGRSLVSTELTKQMKRAATALLVVAVLQTLIGPVMLFVEKARLERESPGMVFEIQPWVWAVIFGIAAAFWILYFWARRSPLPAAIVGLVLFITLHLLEALADPTTLAKGWLIKIIVIVMLVQAIQAGVKYRNLRQGEAATS